MAGCAGSEMAQDCYPMDWKRLRLGMCTAISVWGSLTTRLAVEACSCLCFPERFLADGAMQLTHNCVTLTFVLDAPLRRIVLCRFRHRGQVA
jgi:hypothetical protein